MIPLKLNLHVVVMLTKRRKDLIREGCGGAGLQATKIVKDDRTTRTGKKDSQLDHLRGSGLGERGKSVVPCSRRKTLAPGGGEERRDAREYWAGSLAGWVSASAMYLVASRGGANDSRRDG